MNLDRTHPDFAWKVFDRAQAFIRQYEKPGHANLPRIKELIEQMEQNSGNGEHAEAKQREIAGQIDSVLNPPTPEANPEPAKPNVTDLLGEARVSNVERPELLYLKQLAQHMYKGVHWKKFADGPRCVREPLRVPHITAHLKEGPYIGLAPIVPGTSVTRAALLDLDDHKGETGWDKMIQHARRVVEAIEAVDGLKPQLFRSSGGKGIHIYLLWQEPQDAYSVRQMLADILKVAGFKPGTKGVDRGEVEIFPKQDEVNSDGVGSMWVLPFAKNSIALDAQLMPAKEIPPLLHSKPVLVLEREAPVERNTTPATLDTGELKRLQEALNVIPNEGDTLSYDEWRDIIFAIHHASGGSHEGQQLALEFSRRSPKHDEEFFNNRVWPYIRTDRDNPITAATIFAKAREHGYNEALTLFEDISAATAETEPHAPTPDKLRRFRVRRLHEYVNDPPPDWFIEGVVPKAELIVLYGESTAGKSFVALDIAGAVAHGYEWRGRETHQGGVVYVCAEGMGGAKLRTKAYAHKFSLAPEAYAVGTIFGAPNLQRVEDAREIVEEVKIFGATDLIIIDTLAQVTPGGNENSAEDMGAVLACCRAITRATGATIMLVHHAGKDLTKGARGWSGLKAAADAELEVSRIGEGRVIRVSKLKDGQDGGVFPFRLLPVPVGMDEKGNVIESCVIEHLPDSIVNEGDKATGKWQVAVYKAALELQSVDEQGAPRAEVLNNALERRGYTDGDAKARRMAMNNAGRALRELIVKNLVQVEGDRVLVGNTSSEGE